MSKHILPKTNCYEERTVWIRPDPNPGWRLKVDKARGDLLVLCAQQVFPEHVNNPNARHILEESGQIEFTRDEIVWLHGVFGEILASGEDW